MARNCWPARRPPSSRLRPGAKSTPAWWPPSRRRRRTAPAAACASTPARSRTSSSRTARRSTWWIRSRSAPSSGRTIASSLVFPNSTGRRSRPTRSRAPSCSGRCSSTRARAPAAAKHPTSSCSASSLATGRSSPMPPAARRFMAPTCRPHRGPRTRMAAARPGQTACSRTMPSLALASA